MFLCIKFPTFYLNIKPIQNISNYNYVVSTKNASTVI